MPDCYLFVGFSNSGNTESIMRRVEAAVGERAAVETLLVTDVSSDGSSGLAEAVNRAGEGLGIVFFCPSYGRKRGQVPEPLLQRYLEWLEIALERPIPAFCVYTGNRTFGKEFCAAESRVVGLAEYAGVKPPVTLARLDLRGTSKDIEDIASQL